jgi:2-amino-4-hydroxy-6-hydroxymethyldihydropteridine diphosphokinase
MEKCYILFGSNMGDKSEIFEQACALINNRCGRIVAVSSAYESEPWGFEADEWFLNRLIVIETELAPDELMRQLLDIEAELGRVRHPEIEGYTSRVVDLDILYYGNRVMQTPMVTVPHPRLHLRRFALMPLCELIPDFVHPVLQQTQRELLEACLDAMEVRKK